MKTFVKERIANLNNTTDVERWAVMYFKEKYKYLYTTMAIVSLRSKPARKEYISQCNLKTVQAYQFTNEGYPQER